MNYSQSDDKAISEIINEILSIRRITAIRNKSGIEALIYKIDKALLWCEYYYHVMGEEKIPNFKYDKLAMIRDNLSKRLDNTIRLDVGYSKKKNTRIAIHNVPMLSLSKVFSAEGFKKFIDDVTYQVGRTEIIAEPKIDGIAISVMYIGGGLAYVGTRGDGYVGEDITEHTRHLFPRSIPYASVTEIRAELYISCAEFQKLQGTYSNPRSAVVGITNKHNPDRDLLNSLSYIAYGLYSQDFAIQTQEKCLRMLSRLGFQINERYIISQLTSEIIEWCKETFSERNDLPYVIDGVVCKVNNIENQLVLGATARAPRWAVAYKFADIVYETRLNGITLQVGKTGVVHPVANLKPVAISKYTVKRASLHNANYIAEKDIRIGDIVYLKLSGTVIPNVSGVNKEKRTGEEKKYVFPSNCPCCNSEIVEHGAFMVCSGALHCSAQLVARITHMISRSALDISGMGVVKVQKLVNNGAIKNVYDFFNVPQIQDKIKENPEITLTKFIYLLGISRLGLYVAQNIADFCKTYDNFMNMLENIHTDTVTIDSVDIKRIENIKIFATKENLHQVRLIASNFIIK